MKRCSASLIIREMQIKTTMSGASLVAQWLRICLPMQGTWVWALVREDPTCRGATKLMCHNYWASRTREPQLLKPARHNYWSLCTKSPCSATREATPVRSLLTTTKRSPCLPQLEKACVQQWRPSAAKNKIKKNQKHNEITPLTCQNGYYQKDNK